jgi:hypothetical protein
MRRWWTTRLAAFFATAFLLAAVLQAGPAAAGPWRELRAAQGQPDRQDRGSRPQRDNGQPDRSQRQEQRPQRLSDEEHRGLHRDLDKARREIYKPRPER